MRVALIVLYAVLALVANAYLVRAQDSDEFEGISGPVVGSLDDAVPLPIAEEVEHNFMLEAGSLAIAFVYLINFLLGKSKNRQVADKWLEASEPLLVKEFAYTGSSSEPRVGLLDEGRNQFKYYCTGRRFCSRLVVDIQTPRRHDLLSRLWNVVVPSNDYLTFDVSLNAIDLDPFILTVCKKLEFNALAKQFPEVVAMAKRLDNNAVPSSFCVAADNVEIPKTALSKQFVSQLEELEPFLEYVVITDVNKLPIVGFPNSERCVLRLRFRMQNGSKKLDVTAALKLMTYLIDSIGSTFKLSRDIKASAQKKRAKLAAERQARDPSEIERIKRMNQIKEKKRLEYENLSYEEKQKYDELQEKKQQRKRVALKK